MAFEILSKLLQNKYVILGIIMFFMLIDMYILDNLIHYKTYEYDGRISWFILLIFVVSLCAEVTVVTILLDNSRNYEKELKK